MGTPDVPVPGDALKRILDAVQAGSWTGLDFWIGVAGAIISAVGLYYSIHAFREAKRAAHAAARAVHIHNAASELQEASHKLSGLEANIPFTDSMRDRLPRIITPTDLASGSCGGSL